MGKTVDFVKKGEAAPQTNTAAQNGSAPQQDDFNFAAIENEMYLPDTELTLYGAEMMQIKGRLEKFLHDNTQAVFGSDNQPMGHFLQPHAQPVAELYSLVYRTLHRRFYEDGHTLNFDDYKEKMQTLAMEAEKAEAETAQ